MSGVKGANAGPKHYRYKHLQTNTRLFKIWSGMRDRCQRAKHTHFKDYGGRGIVVCDEWKEFLPFMEWALLNGYDDTKTIDRIDPNKNYDPSNCRWTNMTVQQNNKRNNRIISYRGKTYTLTQLARKSGIGRTTLKERLNAGWSVEDAVDKPIRARKRGWRQSSSCGEKMTEEA